MADTTKAEETVENVANGKTEVNDPATTSGNGEIEKTNGDVTVKGGDESKVTAEDKGEENKSEGSNEHGVDGTHSPDNKRKDTDDHSRDGAKRSRGGGSGRGRGGGRGRGRGRGGYQQSDRNKKIVRTFDDQPESNDPVEIRRQVEFYFSDSNLPTDGYLLGMVEGSENKPVDLRTIHNFKRMRHFQPFSAVADAVKESKVLEVEEKDNTAFVKRKTPLASKFTMDTSENKRLLTSDTMERSIYAKGFGEEGKSTHLDIEDFFEPYGPINSVRLRRTDDGAFKGSVFVEFADAETQKRFLALDPKPTWGDNTKPLQIMSKQSYVDGKHQNILDGTVRPRSPSRSWNNYRGHSGTYKKGGRGGNFKGRRYSDNRNRSRSPDQDDWKNRRDRDQRNGNRNDRDRPQHGGRGSKGKNDRRGRDREEGKERERSPFRPESEEDEVPEQPKEMSRAEAEANKEKQVNGGADIKAEAPAEPVEAKEESSKKRARENDDGESVEGESEVKKVKAEVNVEA